MRFPAKTDLNGLIAALEKVIAEISLDEIPHHLGNLERLKVSLWTRMMSTPAAPDGFSGTTRTADGDQLLTVEEAAQKLSVPKDWLYRHSKKLPFSVRLGPRHLRFSARGIEKFIRQRQGR